MSLAVYMHGISKEILKLVRASRTLLAGASRPVLELGGETTIVRSYADLMTSIINPNAISEKYRDQLL